MKQFIINCLLLMIAITIGISLFFMKQQVVQYEKELTQLTNTILADKREIHTLKADWAVLTEPSRLRHLLQESNLEQIGATQVIQPEEVALQPVPPPPQKPFDEETEIKEDTDAPL